MSPLSEGAAKAFHDHLDVCRRCREQPFNLCPTGAARLQAFGEEDAIAGAHRIFGLTPPKRGAL